LILKFIYDAVAFDSAHNRTYVANSGSDTISVINTNTNTVVGSRIRVSGTPFGAFDPRPKIMYVTSLSSGLVSLIDTNTNTVVGAQTLGPRASGIAFDPRHERMYVPILIKTRYQLLIPIAEVSSAYR
jgi:YVTN family beta-propeller protein